MAKCAMVYCDREATPRTVYCEKHGKMIKRMHKKIRTVG